MGPNPHQPLVPDTVQQTLTVIQQRFTMEGGQTQSTAQTYLGWSIFNTLCCCLPLGIAAIVFSCKAQNANLVGQSAVAEDASRNARVLNIIALVCGIIMLIIVIALKVSGNA